MGQRTILALDQGTTNTKALLVGEDGSILASASAPTGVTYPREGWAEQSAKAIWENSAKVLATVAAQAGDHEIVALGISNQRESILIWDAETGEPLGPCVIWQCLRSAPLVDELRAAGHAESIRRESGLPLDPMLSAGKLRWLLDNSPGADASLAAGTLRAGTVDSWLLWNLSGGAAHATDHGNASRTQLFGLAAAAWSENLCSLFGIPISILPKARSSNSIFGVTASGLVGIPAGIPICAMLGDSHAALYGHGIDRPGRLKVTLGTGSSLMTPIAEPRVSNNGLAGTIAWSRNGKVTYALEGNIAVSGHAAAFAAQLLGMNDATALTALALTVPDNGGVSLIPALTGLAIPHHDPAARGMICGMSLSTTPAHVARAALEAIALQINDVLDAMERDLDAPITEISVDGTAAGNDVLMQMLADLTNRAVVRPDRTELSALGAARLAAESHGVYLIVATSARETRFEPQMADDERQRSQSQWAAAVMRARSQP